MYDRHDVWALDPSGKTAPRNVTDGAGRRDSVRYRVVDLDPDDFGLDLADPLLLAAFDYRTEDGGVARDRITGSAAPERLLRMPRRFSTPLRAEHADVLLFTRESVAEFPHLWLADSQFRSARKVSDANPQQKEYSWATVELVNWRAADGRPPEGVAVQAGRF